MEYDNRIVSSNALQTYPSFDIPIITNINANTSSNKCPEQDGTDNYAFPFKYVTYHDSFLQWKNRRFIHSLTLLEKQNGN